MNDPQTKQVPEFIDVTALSAEEEAMHLSLLGEQLNKYNAAFLKTVNDMCARYGLQYHMLFDLTPIAGKPSWINETWRKQVLDMFSENEQEYDAGVPASAKSLISKKKTKTKPKTATKKKAAKKTTQKTSTSKAKTSKKAKKTTNKV